MQILKITVQDILLVLHYFQHIDDGFSNDIHIQLEFVTHLFVHAPDAIFKVDHDNADGPYIEQLFSNGVHYPYFLRHIGVHKAMFIV